MNRAGSSRRASWTTLAGQLNRSQVSATAPRVGGELMLCLMPDGVRFVADEAQLGGGEASSFPDQFGGIRTDRLYQLDFRLDRADHQPTRGLGGRPSGCTRAHR